VTADIFVNPAAGATPADTPSRKPLEFHRRLPGYRSTPLVDAPALAERLGVARVWVKDESERIGLPSFKALGASWACYQAVLGRLGGVPEWSTLDDLKGTLAPLRPMSFATATDGNHGAAVARMARWYGFGARIFVPAGTTAPRIAAIEREGAEVIVVDGTYDDAVARSAEEAGERCLVVSDTSWPGYEEIPRRVFEGYSTIFWEIEDVLAEPPDAVFIPMGVGALAAATVRHYRRPAAAKRTRLIGVEPASAACVLASLRAGRITEVPGPHESIMAGLNCGKPSYVAWPYLSAGLDGAVAIDDDRARDAMRRLAALGVVSGESGAAGLAGAVALTDAGSALDPSSSVLVLSTEGATDEESYRRIVGT
jgi:diaminopropionate ammonia-lyase